MYQLLFNQSNINYMISLFNYLQECGDCAAPLDTMGMGNPVPADIGVEGTEPLVGKKRKKKKVKESIFDDEDVLSSDSDDEIRYTMVEKWVEENIDKIKDKYTIEQTNGKYKVSFKTKLFCSTLDEEIPEYIVLDLTNVKAIDIDLSYNCKTKEKGKFILSDDSFIFGPHTNLYVFMDSPKISEIEFVGEFDCKSINVSDSIAGPMPSRGVRHIILHKNYKCNWTVYGGLKNLKRISCVGGIPAVIDVNMGRHKILLPEFPGQKVELEKI